MFNFLKTSLRNKLLVTFIGIGFLPFVSLLIYTLFLSQTKIVNKTVLEQFDRTKVVIKLIDNHINSLIKEVEFLSSLDLMDDMLADDIDKRISRLLSKKYNDLDLDVTLMGINLDGSIIASSDVESLSKQFSLKLLQGTSGYYIQDTDLYIYSKIYASFDEDKSLGYLVLEYNLDNLDLFLTHQNFIHSYIIKPDSGFTVGEKLSLNLKFHKEKESVINNKYVIVYKKIGAVLDGWYLVYAVDKDVALEFLYDFISFMLYIAIVIFIIIIYIAIRHSKSIVKPIEELTAITDEITNTQNYSARVEIDSQDEIATLAHSFNKMIETTSSALDSLEEENKLRLKRFVQLIEVFNTIIQTKTEDECMNISIEQMRKLTNKNDLRFHKGHQEANTQNAIALYVSDFEKDTKIYFGSIELSLESFKDENEKNFYNSIATMITLQLDRIRLIERTMSASKAKSAFISNMSHELRTPLNAIIGFSQYLITYEELNDDQQDTVANIESSAQYLLGMINEILDIAKIEAGKMEAHIEETDILELVKSSYNMLLPLADDKGLEFELLSEGYEVELYKTDPKMFKQIVINLLSNAIKFTKEGWVSLHLYTDESYIYVKVKDSGIGLSQEDIQQLFNDFTQVENVMQKKHKGTGLGLSLSKKLANILDGDVELYSEGQNKGVEALFKIKKN